MNDYMFCVDVCESCGISRDKVIRHFEKMFTCDFVLANHERHYHNSGLIRNAETLEYTRMAPIYDTGSCLWHDKRSLIVPADYNYKAKPFGINGMEPKKQLALFHGFEWFDASKLRGFTDRAKDLLALNPYMPKDRLEKIASGLERNVEFLLDFVTNQRPSRSIERNNLK